MDEIVLKGTPIGTMYKRTTARPIDSSEIFDTFKDAEMYAKNTNKTFVPYPGQIVSVKGGNIYKLVIDPTMPDDSAEGFYHCKLAIIGSNDEYDERYIRKDVEDSAQKLIHFLEGINAKGVSTIEQITLLKNIVSDNFATGLSGFGIVRDSDDNYHLDIDFVNIRRKLTVEEIQVQRTYYVGGKQYSTPGGGIICSAVEDKGTEWRCHFKTEDAEGRTVRNTFEPEDYAICETFNLEKKEGSVLGNHYYWRLVVRKGDDYIDLSKSVCSANSDAPKVGDEIVQLGNRTDKNRQGAIVLDSITAGGPYIRVYKGINSYHLPEPNIDLNPELSTIKAKFISEATGKEIDSVLESMKADLDVVRKQTDKEYTMWFFEYDPALDNLPASEWNTDELKSMHEQDMFYNRLTGYAYRFEKMGSLWTWNSITDQQTVLALNNAAKAQDTADGKRRVFVEQPTNAQVYDLGDMWVNATYPNTDGKTMLYDNDTLVCNVSKKANMFFDINHWKPSGKVTTAHVKNLGDKIEIVANRFNKDGSLANCAGLVTTADANTMFAFDANGNIVSFIEQTASSIKINAKHINLTGAVVFNSFTDELKQTINEKATKGDVGETLNSAKDYTDGLKQSLGELAYQSAVEKASLGSTLIDGGYLKTELIDVDNLYVKNIRGGTGDFTGTVKATSGTIGGFNISEDRIGTDRSSTSVTGMSLYDDMILFNGKESSIGNLGSTSLNLQALIGVSSFYGTTILGRFTNTGESLFKKYGMVFNIDGGSKNYAFCGKGDGVLNGLNIGYRFHEYSFTADNQWQRLSPIHSDIMFVYFNYSNCGVVLPTVKDVCDSLDISYTTPFAIKLTIISTDGNDGKFYGRNSKVSGTSGNEYPQLRDQNNSIDTTGYNFAKGDSITVCLFYTGGQASYVPEQDYAYRAYIVGILR